VDRVSECDETTSPWRIDIEKLKRRGIDEFSPIWTRVEAEVKMHGIDEQQLSLLPSRCRRRGSGGEAGSDAELCPASLTDRGGACTAWAREGGSAIRWGKRGLGLGATWRS
jgi:hypothetical protein